MAEATKYSAWSRIDEEEARRFCDAYAAAHPSRLAALPSELAGPDPSALVDGTEASFLSIWDRVLTNEQLPEPRYYMCDHTKMERAVMDPQLLSWYGFAPEPVHPQPDYPLSFPQAVGLSLRLARLSSFICAYVVEMLTERYPEVVWDTHTKSSYVGEKFPCFGGVAHPEQSVNRLMRSALGQKTGWTDADVLLVWYLDCLDFLEDCPRIADTFHDPDESRIDLDEVEDGEYIVGFDDEFAYSRSGQIERIVRHLGRADGIDWTERTDREQAIVATTVERAQLNRLIHELRLSTTWCKPQPRRRLAP